jgi:hypothetical protein
MTVTCLGHSAPHEGHAIKMDTNMTNKPILVKVVRLTARLFSMLISPFCLGFLIIDPY